MSSPPSPPPLARPQPRNRRGGMGQAAEPGPIFGRGRLDYLLTQHFGGLGRTRSNRCRLSFCKWKEPNGTWVDQDWCGKNHDIPKSSKNGSSNIIWTLAKGWHVYNSQYKYLFGHLLLSKSFQMSDLNASKAVPGVIELPSRHPRSSTVGGKCVLRKRSLPLAEVRPPIRRSLRYRDGRARGRNSDPLPSFRPSTYTAA